MSIRKFVFCDICNPQALRSVEFRRAPRADERDGRRISDGRAWFEGEPGDAEKAGWLIDAGRHVCPTCRLLHVESAAG